MSNEPCNCAKDWRLELLDLATGTRVAWLPFTQFDFEVILNTPGTGSITAPIEKVKTLDIFPHLRAVAFTRISGPGASAQNPVCEFIGMIDSEPIESAGFVTIGVQSIEAYLAHRLIIDTGDFSGHQTVLCADQVNNVLTDGIQLFGVDGGSVFSRNVSVADDSDMFVADFINQLTAYDNGPDYQLMHVGAPGSWATNMYFADYIGNTTPRTLNARRGLTAYGITIDAAQHANWVRGRDQELSVIEHDDLTNTIYPRFDKAVKYSEMIDNGTNLEAAVAGELANNKDPIAVPDVTLANLKIAGLVGIGDSLDLDMDYGALRYKGVARVVGKAWALDPDSPTTCTLSMVPISTISDAIFNAPPRRGGAGCC